MSRQRHPPNPRFATPCFLLNGILGPPLACVLRSATLGPSKGASIVIWRVTRFLVPLGRAQAASSRRRQTAFGDCSTIYRPEHSLACQQ
jgi:hypothetical protein